MAVIDDIVSRLRAADLDVVEQSRNGNDNGHRLRLSNGGIVNVFDTGTVDVQGKNQAETRAAIGVVGTSHPSGGDTGSGRRGRKVFVVYGHDEVAKVQLEAMLRRWRIDPMFLDQLPSEGQTLIEKLENYRDQAEFAVVLATPDDEGNRVGHSDERALRARQNVVLELGMMLAALGRSRVAILIKEQGGMERPSDIHGLIYIPFQDAVDDAGVLLAKEMNRQGLAIDLDRL